MSASTGHRIFLSYRREDTAGHAGRLADHLRDRFGDGSVFMDIESIEAGQDFAVAIEHAIDRADAVLAVIGPGWVDAAGPRGGRRLDDGTDYVRREIETGLASDTRVIPVLVGGASMPTEDRLPPQISALARRNAVELQDRRWREDVDALIDVLEGRERSATGVLPAQPTPFIGREREVAEVTALLRTGDVQLVTVTGPGGIGKTRLSIEVAIDLDRAFGDGAWFVPLSSLRDPALIVPTIASTLGLLEGPGSTIEEILARHLRRSRMLLVADNVEQLLPEGARVLAELMAEAPGLALLVSSREPLAVRAERVYPLGVLTTDEAARLFADRARAASPGFEPREADRGAIEEICRRLDDLPLAIELAAARTRIMSPVELLGRLEDRLPLLVGGARDAPERQRTIRATISWSHDLLEEPERDLFARLAVFRGGCSLDAAETVCGADLETMTSLVDKSLLRTEERPPGSTRYVSLETIREFARERLDAMPAADEVRRRHAEQVVDLTREGLTGLKGPEQDAWFARLQAEHDNVRAALRWSLDVGDPSLALELASLSWEFWMMHGDTREGRAWLAETLDRSDPEPSEARALALAGVGWLACMHGEGAVTSTSLHDEALRVAEAATPVTRAYLLAFLGEFLPDAERGHTLCERAVDEARRSGDLWVHAIALNSMAERSRVEGDDDRARVLYEEELRVSREAGDRVNESLCLANLGEMAFLDGDLTRARELLTQAAALAGEVADPSNRSFVRVDSFARIDLGWVHLAEGDIEEGERRFREGLALERELGTSTGARSALAGLAGLAAARGDHERAARLSGAAEALAEQADATPDASDLRAHEPLLSTARAAAGDRWEPWVLEGRRMSLDDACDLALNMRRSAP